MYGLWGAFGRRGSSLYGHSVRLSGQNWALVYGFSEAGGPPAPPNLYGFRVGIPPNCPGSSAGRFASASRISRALPSAGHVALPLRPIRLRSRAFSTGLNAARADKDLLSCAWICGRVLALLAPTWRVIVVVALSSDGTIRAAPRLLASPQVEASSQVLRLSLTPHPILGT